MAELLPTEDLDNILQQHQMERTAQNTQVMCISEAGAEPLCDHIKPVFTDAARDPSMDMTRDMNNENIPQQAL